MFDIIDFVLQLSLSYCSSKVSGGAHGVGKVAFAGICWHLLCILFLHSLHLLQLHHLGTAIAS